jgi:hypothetical protein
VKRLFAVFVTCLLCPPGLAQSAATPPPAGRPSGAADINTYMAEGFSFFQGPSELALIATGARSLLEAAGKSAPDRNRPLY